jgi:hypothetical protein
MGLHERGCAIRGSHERELTGDKKNAHRTRVIAGKSAYGKHRERANKRKRVQKGATIHRSDANSGGKLNWAVRIHPVGDVFLLSLGLHTHESLDQEQSAISLCARRASIGQDHPQHCPYPSKTLSNITSTSD